MYEIYKLIFFKNKINFKEIIKVVFIKENLN